MKWISNISLSELKYESNPKSKVSKALGSKENFSHDAGYNSKFVASLIPKQDIAQATGRTELFLSRSPIAFTARSEVQAVIWVGKTKGVENQTPTGSVWGRIILFRYTMSNFKEPMFPT